MEKASRINKSCWYCCFINFKSNFTLVRIFVLAAVLGKLFMNVIVLKGRNLLLSSLREFSLYAFLHLPTLTFSLNYSFKYPIFILKCIYREQSYPLMSCSFFLCNSLFILLPLFFFLLHVSVSLNF